MAVRASATTPSATSPRRCRCCCPTRESTTDLPLHRWIDGATAAARAQERGGAARERRAIAGASSAATERFIWNKLITGGFRVGVSQQLVVRALVAGERCGRRRDRASVERARGCRARESFTSLVGERDVGRGCLAAVSVLPRVSARGRARGARRRPTEWQAEWKWDGIRAQVIRRDGQTFIWSRGEELVTERFPEIAAAADFLPDGTVLDGEIMPWKDGRRCRSRSCSVASAASR